MNYLSQELRSVLSDARFKTIERITNISKGEEYVKKRNHLTEKFQNLTKGNKIQKITGNKSLFKPAVLNLTFFYQDEITFLHRKLSEALAEKVDTSAYLSTSTNAVNADEPPANGDLVNSKPEKSEYAVIGKRQTLRKNQTQKRSLTQTQVII